MKNKGEFERLCATYPLFKLIVEEKGGIDRLTATISSGHSFHCSLTDKGKLSRESELSLDHEHIQKALSIELMNQYPDLYIHVDANRKGLIASVWVKRNNRDVEAIGDINILALNFRDTINDWQKEAEKAKRAEWFFCSGHQKAEPIEDYGYLHFAGQYCKKYGEENPESRTAAIREDYR